MRRVTLLLVLALALMAGGVAAAQGVDRSPARVDPSDMTVDVPDKAVENRPVLEKVTFIHYKKGFGKPTGCNNDGVCQGWEDPSCGDCAGGSNGGETDDADCYGFLDKWAEWKQLPQDYVIAPDIDSGAIQRAVQEWGSHTNTQLFGTYSVDQNASWDSDKADGRNEFVFGDYPKTGVIAVTNVWGYFSGPPGLREIVEFDVLFDTDFAWGDASIEPALMDLQNIATHEIGHGLGLADLYTDSCSKVTMYGYSDYGETQKQTLEQPDITGLQKLYGS